MELDIKKAVIVTALYDIDRPNWVNFKSSYHTYVTWSEHLLSIDCPIVIYTEEKFFKPLFDIRQKYDPKMDQTKIIVKEKEELPRYITHYPQIKQTMESEEFKKIVQFDDVPEMCQPWYNTLMISKLNWMKEAYLQKYIEGDIFIWKDIAVYREKPEDYKNVKWPDTTKISFTKPTFFTHHDKVSIHKNEHHILSQMRFVQGGSLACPGYLLSELERKYMYQVNKYLAKGYLGSDEKYFDFLVKEDPNGYELIKCSWRDYFRFFL